MSYPPPHPQHRPLQPYPNAQFSTFFPPSPSDGASSSRFPPENILAHRYLPQDVENYVPPPSDVFALPSFSSFAGESSPTRQPSARNPAGLSLASLHDPEPGTRPTYPYPTIIMCAILGSENGRLTLEEIYKAIEERFPWFKTYAPYRNSVRHNLSLNGMFLKVPRPITEPGKGCYWTVAPGAETGASAGTKRDRKRNKKPKKDQIANPPAAPEGQPAGTYVTEATSAPQAGTSTSVPQQEFQFMPPVVNHQQQQRLNLHNAPSDPAVGESSFSGLSAASPRDDSPAVENSPDEDERPQTPSPASLINIPRQLVITSPRYGPPVAPWRFISRQPVPVQGATSYNDAAKAAPPGAAPELYILEQDGINPRPSRTSNQPLPTQPYQSGQGRQRPIFTVPPQPVTVHSAVGMPPVDKSALAATPSVSYRVTSNPSAHVDGPSNPPSRSGSSGLQSGSDSPSPPLESPVQPNLPFSLPMPSFPHVDQSLPHHFGERSDIIREFALPPFGSADSPRKRVRSGSDPIYAYNREPNEWEDVDFNDLRLTKKRRIVTDPFVVPQPQTLSLSMLPQIDYQNPMLPPVSGNPRDGQFNAPISFDQAYAEYRHLPTLDTAPPSGFRDHLPQYPNKPPTANGSSIDMAGSPSSSASTPPDSNPWYPADHHPLRHNYAPRF